jgi:hypothetical protein
MCSTCEFQKGKNRKFEIIMEENNGVTQTPENYEFFVQIYKRSH